MSSALAPFPGTPFWSAFKSPPKGRSWSSFIDKARKGETSNRVESIFSSDLVKARTECLGAISRISMHLPNEEWRVKLVAQVDALLDESEWAEDYKPPSLASFETALRALLVLEPDKRPGFAVGPNGNFAMMWMNGSNRLTIECLKSDVVRFVLSNTLTSGVRERDAGETVIERLADVLQPYNPAQWLSVEDNEHPAE